jgi:hypothetical protein
MDLGRVKTPWPEELARRDLDEAARAVIMPSCSHRVIRRSLPVVQLRLMAQVGQAVVQ